MESSAKSGWYQVMLNPGNRLIFRAVVVLVAAAAVAISLPGRAQELPQVTVNVFPGGFNWPSFIARDKGLFERNGIRVALQFTPNSVAQMTGLAQGKFDIAITAVDNIVAYVEGQGEAPIGPQPEFFAFMGSDSGFLNLVATPDIKSFSGLKGKTLSVDARTTGYAFVLFEMLDRNGLHEGDYSIEKVGGTTQRWAALREKRQSGTLLSAPFNLIAQDEHFTDLATATSVIGPYQGNVGATRRSWAAQNKTLMIAFIRGYVQAIDWLYDPTNREEAIRILEKNVPEISPGLAERTYDELLNPREGFFRGCQVNFEGLRTVLTLRSRYAEPPKTLTDPLKYYDPSFCDSAMSAQRPDR